MRPSDTAARFLPGPVAQRRVGARPAVPAERGPDFRGHGRPWPYRTTTTGRACRVGQHALLACGIVACLAALPATGASPARAAEATSAAPATQKPEAPPARNVILLIGDGMGPEQVKLGRIA